MHFNVFIFPSHDLIVCTGEGITGCEGATRAGSGL